MKRRDFLEKSALLGLMAAVPASPFVELSAATSPIDGTQSSSTANPLKPPAQGSIPVGFLLSEGAVVIDFCGPWEVFQDVSVPGRMEDAFRLYTVAETTKPIRASGGLTIVPDYTLSNAPAPKIIVIPAQHGHSQAMLDWIRKSSRNADVTMSVCTGAFLLASTGLLAGKPATTHHSGYKGLEVEFPDVQVKRGARFVEAGNLATAGGLSSGIDLSLRVVERYFGREVATQTAYYLEYQGQGWMNPDSNQLYAQAPVSSDEHPLCPVCEMEVDPKTAPTSAYKGKTYYFCSQDHKQLFDQTPDRYIAAAQKR
ncbi:MAG TPA: DJ-1/PfpI family protein [Terriglobales bacterium]|nr:DJ-1/PfpI family protein [Terriglobales bacterium]